MKSSKAQAKAEKQSEAAKLAQEEEEEDEVYRYSYAVGSANVKKYLVNDVGSVATGISMNIVDYIEWHDMIDLKERLTFGDLFLAFMAIGASVTIHFYAAQLPLPILYGCVGFVIVVLGSLLYKDGMLTGSDLVFATKPMTKEMMDEVVADACQYPEVKRNLPKYIPLLGTQNVCVYLRMNSSRLEAELEARIIEPARFRLFPTILASRSYTYTFDRYFSEDGRIFPPQIVDDVDRLLDDLLVKHKNDRAPAKTQNAKPANSNSKPAQSKKHKPKQSQKDSAKKKS